jgi:hypothetical protein
VPVRLETDLIEFLVRTLHPLELELEFMADDRWYAEEEKQKRKTKTHRTVSPSFRLQFLWLDLEHGFCAPSCN